MTSSHSKIPTRNLKFKNTFQEFFVDVIFNWENFQEIISNDKTKNDNERFVN